MKKTKLILAICFLLMRSTFVEACLNGESTVLKSGILLYEDHEGRIPYGHHFFIEDGFVNELKELDSLYSLTRDLDYLSDRGVLLIILGHYGEAINLYLEIEKMEPYRYSTASNLGTAYELAGQNESALVWIKKSIDIDSTAHYNSEWIHKNIIEAKIKGEQYYTSMHLLNCDFGTEATPYSELTREKLEELANALYYQLNERISFVKPKEKIVAQLVFELGNIELILGNNINALADYGRSTEYGFSGRLLESRINLIQNPTSAYLSKIIAGSLLVLSVGITFYFLRKRRKTT